MKHREMFNMKIRDIKDLLNAEILTGEDRS